MRSVVTGAAPSYGSHSFFHPTCLGFRDAGGAAKLFSAVSISAHALPVAEGFVALADSPDSPALPVPRCVAVWV